ncbi:hypothetical protein QO200_12765 [Flavobacterium sp. Arc3]|uniref:hypothetical protein n=1 Tax=Flavobacterium sp. Arc3 TaxID=3046686 RepID=UPI00352CD03E
MIKIHLASAPKIIDFHYNNICGKQPGKQQNISKMFDKYIKKYKHNRYYREVLEYLKLHVEKDSNGFSLITAEPLELKKFIENFNLKFTGRLTPKLKSILSYVFYYEDLSKWKAYELGKKLSINVCPYCNRSYTFIVGNDIIKGTRFEYDHFFSQTDYPYLSLSFYNLIPSCHICNSNFKGDKKFSLENNIHPYLEGFSNEIVFSIKPRNINFINGKSTSYRIRFKKGENPTWSNEKIKSAFENITTFQLTKLYNMHKDYVDEIIMKGMIYSPAYINALYMQFQGTLFNSESDVKRFVTGNYVDESDYSKRVLSKLSADISKELGLI